MLTYILNCVNYWQYGSTQKTNDSHAVHVLLLLSFFTSTLKYSKVATIFSKYF